ncbi:MAG: cytochrome d ubiquinol oxidase subunit II [Acidimicrobiia bacterium]|nr:cytochrome d ubiquinol oxidase subunit II [Acidimicrobiia bacterium]
MADATAIVLFLAISVYAIFGGADFGAGFWDLFAGGAERGRRPRALIEHAIGPVWEANHVWLIFCLVVLWTAFAETFASIFLTLFVPLSIAALGIVLRGSGFAFRKVVPEVGQKRVFGAAFAVSSVIVPFSLGAVVGGIVSGRVPAGGTAGDPVSSWINGSSIVGGLLAVAVCAYLSAVFLAHDAHRLGEDDLVGYFRRRAIGAGVVAGLLALVGYLVLDSDAHHLHDHLGNRALPLVIASTVSGLVALVLLFRGSIRAARGCAVAAVATVVWGWGVAQWPYLLPTTLTIEQGAATRGTLVALVVVTVAAVVLIGPSLALLYVLDQRNALELEESAAPDHRRAPATSTGN